MWFFDWIEERLLPLTPGQRRDRKAWREARTLADLGELTARWLEGTNRHMPGYCGSPDDETLPLVSTLAALNRAGFVTYGSQPGESCTGYDGAWWEQRAAVEGFAEEWTLAAIEDGLRDTGMIVSSCYSRSRRRVDPVTVTTRAGESHTRFGSRRRPGDLRDSWTGYGVCHPDAVEAVVEAWQVTVVDPEWGRNDRLWPLLTGALCGERAS